MSLDRDHAGSPGSTKLTRLTKVWPKFTTFLRNLQQKVQHIQYYWQEKHLFIRCFPITNWASFQIIQMWSTHWIQSPFSVANSKSWTRTPARFIVLALFFYITSNLWLKFVLGKKKEKTFLKLQQCNCSVEMPEVRPRHIPVMFLF